MEKNCQISESFNSEFDAQYPQSMTGLGENARQRIWGQVRLWTR